MPDKGYTLVKKMKFCRTLITVFVLAVTLCWGLSPAVNAYVMTGPHLLYRMAANLQLPKRFMVEQHIFIYRNGPFEEAVELTGRAYYQSPGNFRSETDLEGGAHIYLAAAGKAISIVDGRIVSVSDSVVELYGIALGGDREWLENRLTGLGVDVSVVSLGLFNGRIGYIVGAQYPDESVSQLWLDQETFRPFRLVIHSPEDGAVTEFRYLNWEKAGRAWYPREIDIHENGESTRVIDVRSIKTNVTFDKALFDIDAAMSRFPMAAADDSRPDTGQDDDLNRMKQSIEDFKSMYE